MATEAQTQELLAAIKKLKGRGTYRSLFDKYAGDDAMLDGKELLELLEDAGVGNWATRSMWRDGVMEAVDSKTAPDSKISWPELQQLVGDGVASSAGPSPGLWVKVRRMYTV